MNKDTSSQNNFSLRAILSERANYIVSKMAHGCDYSAALLDAQQRFSAVGKDQRDLNDLKNYEGRDAVGRLALLVEHCFGTKIFSQDIFCRGIAFLSPIDFEMAAFLGYAIKYLGIVHAQDGFLDVRMHATLISQKNPLSLVNGAQVGVEWLDGRRGQNGHDGLYIGPTDSFLKVLPQLETQTDTVASILDLTTRYYVRFSLQDSLKAVSEITRILSTHNIEIQHLHKKGEQPGSIVPLIVVTHAAKEKNIREALKEIDGMNFITQMTKMIRIDA